MSKVKAKAAQQKAVSMTFLKSYGRHAVGDRAGFQPEMVKKLEALKVAVPSVSVKKDGGKTEQKGTEGADKV